MSARPVVLQLTRILADEEPLARLRRTCEWLEGTPDDLDVPGHPFEAAAAEAEAVIITVTEKADAAFLDRFPRLRLLASYSAGFNHIDLSAAADRGIQVSTTPGVLSEACADLTWGLMLAAARRIPESDQRMRTEGFPGWRVDDTLGVNVYGKTLGVVGLGDIGQGVARRASGFRMRVLYSGRRRAAEAVEADCRATFVPLETLLAESDFVALTCPLTPETRHLINTERLRQMKPTAVLVNTGRGPLVDEAALAEALQHGLLFAAGLDVFEYEPAVHPKLLTLKNVVLTSHIASATGETRRQAGNLVIDNVLDVLVEGRAPRTELRLPEGVGR